MNRATLVVVTVLSLIGMPRAHAQVDDRALRLQQHVLGVDAHNDTVQRILYFGADLGLRSPSGPVDLPRLREGGMHVPFFALWVPMYYKGSEAVRRTLDFRDKMQELFDNYLDTGGGKKCHSFTQFSIVRRSTITEKSWRHFWQQK